MSDDAPEIFVDGFAEHISMDGVMRCVGYQTRGGRRVIVVRLAWPEVNTQAAIGEAMDAMGVSVLPTQKPLRRRVH